MTDPENHPSCPTCATQPAHWSNIDRWGTDVHDNNGIANKFAWLLGREPSEGSANHAGIGVTGIGAADTAHLLYDVILSSLTRTTNLHQFRNAVVNRAWLKWSDTRAYKARDAINAIGLWSSDIDTGLGTRGHVALATHYIRRPSEVRKYLFWRDSDQTRLYYTYQTCNTLFGSSASGEHPCGWVTPTQISSTDEGPSASYFDDKLWVFFKSDVDNRLYYRTINEWGIWSESDEEVVEAHNDIDESPSAIAFDGYLYVFYRRQPTPWYNYAYYVRWSPSTGWEGPYDAGFFHVEDSPVAVGPLGGKLYLVFKRDVPNCIGYATMPSSADHTNWVDSMECIEIESPGPPAAAVFRNRLHIAAKSLGDDVYYTSYCPVGAGCTYRPGEWTNIVRQPSTRQAERSVSIISGEAIQLLDPYLYVFTRNDSTGSGYPSLHWRAKISE